MSMVEAIAAEFAQEARNTRKLLERVPEEHFDWGPHEKSMTMAALATHIAEIPQWGLMTLDQDEFTLDTSEYTPKMASSSAELLGLFEERVQAFGARLKAAGDGELLQPWRMLVDGEVKFELPRIAVLRGMILNHTYHHRGQLEVYLRIKGVPLPAIYGPSADEDM